MIHYLFFRLLAIAVRFPNPTALMKLFFFFVQQITARVSILVPSRPACIWKGPGAQSPDLLSVQPLCRVAKRQRQVSRRTNRVYFLVRF